MSDIAAQLAKTLGVAPLPAPVAPRSRVTSLRVDPRPTPLYEYEVNASQILSASWTVVAVDLYDAYAVANDALGDVEFELADSDINDATKISETPYNLGDLEEWDESYAGQYDADGDVICYACARLLTDDTLVRDGDGRYYCTDCV